MRILLADDALILGALRNMIERIPGASVVAEALNGRDAVALAVAHRPDLVIMDISMKELDGIEAMAQIRELVPSARVLILSSHTDEEFVRRAVEAGAHGCLVKGSPPAELAAAIGAIAAGKSYPSPASSRHVISGLQAGAGRASELDLLTARQREILKMVAEGKGTREIAGELEVSVETIETHRAELMERLGLRDVAGLAIFAVRHGLIDLDRPGHG